MEEILACRLCLSTNVKLFNMYKYQLNTAYENLTGIEMTAEDSMRHACSICSALLLKSASFQTMCRQSQDLLKFAGMQQHLISTEYIESLKINSPHSNFKVHTNIITLDITYADQKDLKVESYWDDDWPCDNVKDNESSDEEPLSTMVVKEANNIKSSNSDDEFDDNKRSDKRKVAIKLERKTDFSDLMEPTGKEVSFNLEDNVCNDKLVKTEDLDKNIVGNSEVNDEDKDFREGEVNIITLTKEEQIEEVQARKTSLNYLNSVYKCNHCFKGFLTDATYKNHMARHDPTSGSHVCEICQTRWANARALKAHLGTSHEKKFICKLCNHSCKSKFKAKEHSKWHTGRLIVCKFCGASFSHTTSHLTHIRLHHPSKHACDVCGESFIGETGLNMHKRKAHRDLKNGQSKAAACCPHCNMRFQNADALRRHAAGGQPCDVNSRPCLQCGEGFPSDDQFREHLKVHTNKGPVKCEECNRTFAHERSYSIHHQRVHARVPPARATRRAPRADSSVVCEVCGKKCNSNATLRYHQRTHTGERPFQCTECPKRFSIFQRLQIHVRTHTGERPYKCSHCPKAFKHKAALNRHDRVHTGAKPYACSHCGKSFSQSNSMKLHIRTVHLKMPSPYRSRRLPPD